MWDRILFPTDGSDGAAAVFDHVLDIAVAHDATVHLLNVADTTQDSVLRIQGDVIDVLEGEGRSIVSEAAERARDRGVESVTEVLQGEPYSTIVDYADSREIDLIIMPTRGRSGLGQLLLGSTADRVVRHADVPVLTVRPDDAETLTYPYRSVLVPTDGSDCAMDALATGIEVANTNAAALHLLFVVAVPTLGVDVRTDLQTDFLEESGNEILDEAAAVAADGGVESISSTLEYGSSIPGAIRSYIENHDIDLVVVGTHGRTGLDRYILGSVTEQLVRTAPVPVMTVREPGRDE